MTAKRQKEYALSLYCSARKISLLEIAERVGVHMNTISRWKVRYNWDEHAASILTTKPEQIRFFYTQLKDLNDHIMARPKGQRFGSKSENDGITQLTNAIEKLEKQMVAKDVIDVFTPFINYVAEIDPEAAKKFIEYQDLFVKQMPA